MTVLYYGTFVFTCVIFRLNEWCRKKPKPQEPKRTMGKLTVTVNNRTLVDDPDNPLPWELEARDSDVPETNFVQSDIEARREKRESGYVGIKGLSVLEKEKEVRPDTSRSDKSRAVSIITIIAILVFDYIRLKLETVAGSSCS